jgi:integrase
MLLLGFGAALRRSELVSLSLGDVETVPGRGLLVTIGRSKTDQHGVGQRVAVWANPTEPGFCPEAALDSPTSRAARPLFCAVTKVGRITGERLSDKAVARLIKQTAADAGLDAARFSGHSLRRGLLTAGGENRAALADLMRQSRHRSVASVLGYVEAEDLWRNNVTEGCFGGRHDSALRPRAFGWIDVSVGEPLSEPDRVTAS